MGHTPTALHSQSLSQQPSQPTLANPVQPQARSLLPMHGHHLSFLGSKRLTMKARSFCDHLHRKKAGSGWRGPSPKPWISCDLRQHFARPDKLLPQGQTNQPLHLPSRVYRGKKRRKSRTEERQQQRINGRRASSHREGLPTTKVQFQS